MQRVHGYRNKYGKWVSSYTRRGNSRSQTGLGGQAPQASAKRAAIATTVTVMVTVAGVSVGVGLSGGGSLPVSNDGAATRAASVETYEKVRVDLRRTEAALLASGYRVNLDLRYDPNCAAYSYGLVHHFFLAHPCKWVARASLTLRASDNSVILVAISCVDMRNTALAKAYKRLVDAPGTGNVLELSRQSGPYKNVRFTGDFYESGMVETGVWNVQVQPTGQLPISATRNILKDWRQ